MTVAAYFLPTSVGEAIGLLRDRGPDLLVIAGGTVAMPLVNEGISLPREVMGLRRAGLDRIERDGDTLRIGATATLSALARQADAPLLAEAARRTASWAIRNMGTVGGNLFTPPPGGDVATALLALDATVEVAGPNGTRSLPLASLWTGFLTTSLAGDELVTGVGVRLDDPGAGASAWAFEKLGRRAANTPAVVSVAVTARLDGDGRVTDGRVALGSVGPHPVRSAGAEAALAGNPLADDVIEAAAMAAIEDTDPVADAVASDWYRRRMTGVIVRRTLERLAARTRGEA